MDEWHTSVLEVVGTTDPTGPGGRCVVHQSLIGDMRSVSPGLDVGRGLSHSRWTGVLLVLDPTYYSFLAYSNARVARDDWCVLRRAER